MPRAQRFPSLPTPTGFVLNNPTSSSLRIDFSSFTTEANLDYLSIFSGNVACPSTLSMLPSSQALLSRSGSSVPGPVYTSASSVTFCFLSDSSVVYSGVSMQVSVAGGGSSTAVADAGGLIGGIIAGVVILFIVLPIVICVLCCGGVAAGCARCTGRGDSPFSPGKATTVVMMGGGPAPVFGSNPLQHPQVLQQQQQQQAYPAMAPPQYPPQQQGYPMQAQPYPPMQQAAPQYHQPMQQQQVYPQAQPPPQRV